MISSILMWWFGMIMFFIFVFEFGWFLVRLILDFNLIGWVYIVDMLKCMVLLVVIIVFVFFWSLGMGYKKYYDWYYVGRFYYGC